MRVVIAEDQALLREGLARLFADGGHEVVASLADAGASRRTWPTRAPGPRRGRHPHAADVHRRGRPGGARDQGDRTRTSGVLVLSQHIETTHAVDLVTLGGFGYLLKDRVLEVDEFLAAAQRVADGGSALDPQVVARLVSAPRARTIRWTTSRRASARSSS